MVETNNLADQMVYAAEKALKDGGDKISSDIVEGVKTKIEEVKKAQSGGDVGVVKTTTEALSTEMQKIGQAMASQQQSSEGSDSPNKEDGGKPEGEVKDAEFEEKSDQSDEDKK